MSEETGTISDLRGINQTISAQYVHMSTTTGQQLRQCVCCQSFTYQTCIRGACTSCHMHGLCHDDV